MSNQGYGRNPYWAPEYTGRKPSFNDMGALRLNPDNVLNQGLNGLWLINDSGNVIVNLVTAQQLSIGTATKRMGFHGNELVSAGGTTSHVSLGITPGATYSIEIKVVPAAVTNSARVWSMGNIKDELLLYSNRYDFYGNGYDIYPATAPAVNGTYATVTCTLLSSTRARMYFNGALVGEDTSITNSSHGALTLFNYSGGGSAPMPAGGAISYARVYERELTSPEVMMSHLNPYGTPSNPLFLVMGTRSYFVPSYTPPGGFIAAWARQRSRIIGGGLNVS